MFRYVYLCLYSFGFISEIGSIYQSRKVGHAYFIQYLSRVYRICSQAGFQKKTECSEVDSEIICRTFAPRLAVLIVILSLVNYIGFEPLVVGILLVTKTS